MSNSGGDGNLFFQLGGKYSQFLTSPNLDFSFSSQITQYTKVEVRSGDATMVACRIRWSAAQGVFCAIDIQGPCMAVPL